MRSDVSRASPFLFHRPKTKPGGVPGLSMVDAAWRRNLRGIVPRRSKAYFATSVPFIPIE
jgi:hypothetical protein